MRAHVDGQGSIGEVWEYLEYVAAKRETAAMSNFVKSPLGSSAH